MFCSECGRKIASHRICPYCHALQSGKWEQGAPSSETISNPASVYGNRSYVVAGFLQIFLGAFGIGRFYLGYRKTALLQILSSLLSCGIVGVVWGFIDGVMILNGKEKYDAKGKLMI